MADIEHDISIEPLLNQSSIGIGSSRRLAFVIADSVGATSHRTAVPITNVAVEITIGANKRSIEIQNSGENIIFYGGAGVTSADGIKLFPNQVKPFSNVSDDFSIFFVADGTDNSEIRVAEFE